MIIDYFVASSDDEAAAMINWPSGPSRPPEGAGLPPTFSAKNVEPFVALGKLEELLGGRNFEQQLAESAQPVAIRGEGERLVVPLPSSLVALVRQTDPSQLEGVAEPWSEIEEFSGFLSPRGAAAFIKRFRDLCVQAHRAGDGVYCWISV